MSKSNYSKVEEALNQGLHRWRVQELFEATEQLSEDAVNAKKQDAATKRQIARIQTAMRTLKKVGHDPYLSCQIDKTSWKKLSQSTSFTPEARREIEDIDKRLGDYKRQLEEGQEALTDQEQVEWQRQKQINSRFNINDKWLPLQ